MAIGHEELMSVFKNTHAWGQQERNKIKNVRREVRVRKEAKGARKKEDPTAYHILIKIQR